MYLSCSNYGIIYGENTEFEWICDKIWGKSWCIGSVTFLDDHFFQIIAHKRTVLAVKKFKILQIHNFNRVKWLLGWQPVLGALGGHLHFIWDTQESLCVSLHLQLLFTCSSLSHTYFTCGSLGQQSVQWVIHSWLIRAWRPAFPKHSLISWFQQKLYLFWSAPCLSKCLSVYPWFLWIHSFFAFNYCSPLADFLLYR